MKDEMGERFFDSTRSLETLIGPFDSNGSKRKILMDLIFRIMLITPS